MTKLADNLTRIDDELPQALAALRGARAAANHSPNADTIRAEERAEQRVNNLLDRRLRAVHK